MGAPGGRGMVSRCSLPVHFVPAHAVGLKGRRETVTHPTSSTPKAAVLGLECSIVGGRVDWGQGDAAGSRVALLLSLS